MEKTRRLLAGFFMVIMIAAAVSGCGKKKGQEESTVSAESVSASEMTAEELVRKAKETMDSASSIKGRLVTEAVMDYSAQGTSATLELNMDQEIENIREPETAHTKGTLNINFLDSIPETESYSVREGDSYIVYTASGPQGGEKVWVKQKKEAADMGIGASDVLESLLANPASLVLSRPEGESGAYQVDGTVKGEYLNRFLGSVDGLFGGRTDSSAELSTKISLTAGADGTLSALSIDFTESYNQYMQDNKEAQGFDEITIKTFTVTMSEYEFNTVETIVVPEEVIASAVAAEDLENGEETAEDPDSPDKDYELRQDEGGNYVLAADGEEYTAVVSVPSGYTYNAGSDGTWLRFDSRENDGDYELTLVYTLYVISDNYSEEDLARYQESSYAYMQSSGDYAQPEFTPLTATTAGGRKVSYTCLSDLYLGTIYETEYNTWTVLSDGRMVQCTIRETSRKENYEKADLGVVLEKAYSALQ